MYANNYFTGYVGESIEDVLDIKKFTTDGWGPWHEVGHQHQQILVMEWAWRGNC